MQRKIYLEGELGEKFGTNFTVHAENMQEIFRCIDANHDGFKKYLIDCHEKNVGFVIDVADKNIQHEPELLLPLKEGDVTVTVVPAGSKGFGKILAAIAVVALVVAAPYMMGAVQTIGTTSTVGGMTVVGSSTTLGSFTLGQALAQGTLMQTIGAGLAASGTLGTMAMGLATNLAMTGLSEMMAPDPAKDTDQESSYMFNGAEQNVIEGDPVPVLYGNLRIPGQPIVFDTITGGPASTREADDVLTWRDPDVHDISQYVQFYGI